MAAASKEVHECLRAHLIDVLRFLEGGNHDRLQYILLHLVQVRLGVECAPAGDIWTLKLPELTHYTDHLVREAREAVTDANHSRSTDAFQAGSIFTGEPGPPKLEVPQEQLQFLAERRFNTPQIGLQTSRYYRSQTSSDQIQNTTLTQQSIHDTFACFRVTLSDRSFCIISKTADRYV